jgi:hypothetical protein
VTANARCVKVTGLKVGAQESGSERIAGTGEIPNSGHKGNRNHDRILLRPVNNCGVGTCFGHHNRVRNPVGLWTTLTVNDQPKKRRFARVAD